MLWVNYERGVGRGQSPGLAAAVSAHVFTLIVGAGGTLLWYRKHKGGELRWDELGEGHPGEDRKPPGWIWDERSKRWRKPPRSGP